MYQELSPTKEKAWFQKLLDPTKTKEVPKAEQERFLRTIARRCQYEASVTEFSVEKREKCRDFEAPRAYVYCPPIERM